MLGSSGEGPTVFVFLIKSQMPELNGISKGTSTGPYVLYLKKPIFPNDNCQHENYLKTEMLFIKSCFIQQGLITPNKNPKTPEVVLQHECGFCGILYGIEVAFIRGCCSGDQNNHQPNS